MRRLCSAAGALLAGAARRRGSGATPAAAAAADAWPAGWTPPRRWTGELESGCAPWAARTTRPASTLAPRPGRPRDRARAASRSPSPSTPATRRGRPTRDRPATMPPLPRLPPPDAAPFTPARPADLPPGFPTSYAALAAAADARAQGGDAAAPTASNGVARGTLFAARDRLLSFARAPATRARALELYVNDALFNDAMAGFKRVLVRGSDAAATAALAALPRTAAGDDALFALFADHCVARHADAMATYRDMVRSIDMRAPHLWYRTARALRRRITYHAGPTNSGKTHAALAALAAAPTGVYAGPLRLLAMEVYDELNARGVRCSLVTGQERQIVPGARHAACTVEMVDPATRVAVAVIDEVQMIGDTARGWAWTRALHGLAADDVHVCGSAAAVDLVRALAADAGDDFTVVRYARLSPLALDDPPTVAGGLAGVRRGDAVVAFSRAGIHRAKAAVEAATGLRACVVYGALPPETRRRQARLFNDPASGMDVLIASDAVGMGLNLNIRRVVFETLSKPSGASGAKAPLPVPSVQQIAGRAGRASSEYSVGLTAVLHASDAPTLAAALAEPTRDGEVARAGLSPEFEQLEAYAGRHVGASYASLLASLADDARLSGRYFFASQADAASAARALECVAGLSLRERHLFTTAPANLRSARQRAALLGYARAFAAGGPVTLASGAHPPSARGVAAALDPPPSRLGSPAAMAALEEEHACVSLWMWLANRFEEGGVFGPRSEAEAAAAKLVRALDAHLEAVSARAAAAGRRAKARAEGGGGDEGATRENETSSTAAAPRRRAKRDGADAKAPRARRKGAAVAKTTSGKRAGAVTAAAKSARGGRAASKVDGDDPPPRNSYTAARARKGYKKRVAKRTAAAAA